MTEYSLEWSGTVDHDAGPYSDDDWSDWIRALFQQDRTFQGVIPNYLNGLECTGVATPVTVQAGAALVDGKRYFSDAAENIVIPTPGGATRIDVIVLRKSWASQQVRLTRVAGVEGGGVPAISQADGVTWDIPIAQLSVTTGGVITVTDRRRLAFAAISQKPVQMGRLTLTSGTPITSSDVTAASTVYYTPYIGNVVSLYSGLYGGWVDYNFVEMSIAVPASTGTNYDLFIYDAGEGVLTLEYVAWTNDTTRATALTTVHGRPVKSGATDHLFLGTFRTTGVSGETEDSDLHRYLSNYWHRQPRRIKTNPQNQTWNHPGGGVYRAADNDTTNNVVEFVMAYTDMAHRFELWQRENILVSNGVGVNTTAAFSNYDAYMASSQLLGQQHGAFQRVGTGSPFQNGYNYVAWLEYLAGGVARANYGWSLGTGAEKHWYGLIGYIEM